MDENKAYKSYKIPSRNPGPENGTGPATPAPGFDIAAEEQCFAEIELEEILYASRESVPPPQPIKPAVQDEIRTIFNAMREISRSSRSPYFIHSRFYQKHAQYENSKIFYKQAEFMKDFEDDYPVVVPCTEYFPFYQLMSYEQLRTYFTWRSKVRRGSIESIPLSYVFLYIYELLNNIGVSGPEDGLSRLVALWKGYAPHGSGADSYIIRWLKDYHIYYELKTPFRDFIQEHGLDKKYPEIISYTPDSGDNFEQLHVISKYNIKKSVFYNEENRELIENAFNHAVEVLKDELSAADIKFSDLLFQPSQRQGVWTPFRGALFYPAAAGRDRRVTLSGSEIYICRSNVWTVSTLIPIESGKQLVGYILKQTEAVLRRALKFKYKLNANPDTVSPELISRLEAAGISLKSTVTKAIAEFYRELTKTVVSVDTGALHKIRAEALQTQDKLTVPEETPFVPVTAVLPEPAPEENKSEEASPSEGWSGLKNALDETETAALALVLKGNSGFEKFAGEHGLMPEVLADSINEKAVDYTGDSILDEEFFIFEEYTENVRRLVGGRE